MPEGIITLATVLGSLLTIWAFVARVISPIKSILNKYESSLEIANKKLEKMEQFISEHQYKTTGFEVEFARRKTALHYILRYILYEETARSKHNGYRIESVTRDLEMIYQYYTDEGLNGLGSKIYHEYLDLPTYDQWKEQTKK